MSRRSCIACLALSGALSGCIAQPTGAAKLQLVAYEANNNMRFGRMEMAMENVAEKQRDAFAQRHKWWGGRVRVADAELSGLRMLSRDDAFVLVRVAWYRADEGDLRVTT